jgi:hypothetical protein
MNYDREVWNDIRIHARDLKSIHGVRDREFDEYEKMYLMDFTAENSKFSGQDIMKLTPSPSARNKVLNACRLMMSQEPVFDINASGLDESKLEGIEKNISRWWGQAGRAARRPLHYDMILSALLYDEMHTAITIMDDYKAYNKNDKRAERVSKITPILFQSWNPREGYPEFDELGLCAYYRESQVRWSYVAQKYQSLLKDKYDYVNKRNTDNVQLKIFYDLTHYAIWINEDDPLICDEHNLPCIPIDVTLINGSTFFEKEEDRRQPLLFSIMRSHLWDRESLLYTVLYSLLFTLGVTPTFVYKTDSEDDLIMQHDGAISYYQMRKGDTLDPLDSKGILPPEVQKLSEITGTLIDESTMYSTAFGERGGSSQTFSETSLLQQAARLPLIGPQRLGGFGISSTIEMALSMMKARHINFNKNGYEIKSSEIPEDIEVKAKLDVILPQEKLQLVNVGLQMQKLGMPDEYIQSNLLGITNTKEIASAFVKQQAANSLVQYKLQQKVNRLQQSDQQEEQLRNEQLQNAIAAARNAAAGSNAEGGMRNAEPAPDQMGLTQGQQIEAQLMSNAMQQGQMPMPEAGGPMPMPTEGMEGGLPGAMGGMIPGQGLAGTPDESGMMR